MAIITVPHYCGKQTLYKEIKITTIVRIIFKKNEKLRGLMLTDLKNIVKLQGRGGWITEPGDQDHPG